MPDSHWTFPFGRPVKPCQPKIAQPRRFFILGAYPSAMHVFWTPPSGFKPVRAIAVDNEPVPFWAGDDEERLVLNWKRLHFQGKWGSIACAGKLNGSSGFWVKEQILFPLNISPDAAWMTDCLDTYRCSADVARRIDDTYARLPTALGLPSAHLQPHPSEVKIVDEALEMHRNRIKRELAAAQPETIVTLGNAALRVLQELVNVLDRHAPRKLTSSPGIYGECYDVRLGTGRIAHWIPLAHPASPPIYQQAHADWIARLSHR